jgi:cytochrome c oxidase subunit 3
MTNIKDLIIKNSATSDLSSEMPNRITSKFNRGVYQLHPYHLVEPSPWPFFISFTLFGLTFNTVLVMHGYIGSVYIIFLNTICVIYCMSLWFRDIISEGSYLGNHTIAVKNGINLGFILFVISEVMFFFAIFWAYIHSALAPTIELGSVWPPINIQAIGPLELPLLNTIILLTSGATITYSHHTLIGATNPNARKAAILWLFLTIVLAILFTLCQYIEYINATFTITDGVFGSVFFFSTGFHALHVIVGTLYLITCLWRLYSYHFTNTHHLGYETAILYWHFVDIVWLLVFILIYWWGS